MTVTFEISAALEQNLRTEFTDLNQTAKESMLVELYRLDKITHFELSESLGLTRLETESLLKKHNVTEDFPTPDVYNAALDRLRAIAKR